ncbi:fibronectin type III domain-containing protein [Brachybacterium paraconglomeratum]|uniref:fibronectin type III domain-containing protein n=1 Tax=Brachybacterium paraconglomeratum TaxID=173362 RepID=UPI0011103CE1|nr:fibronectin type III domain-containing protein [Brachybacterium paraconglomeratum]
MPSTPSRGYTYPTTSSPATVPADLRVPLEQIDADVQTLTDQMEGAVRLEEDGSLPVEVESRVEGIAREFGTPPGSIPIFPTLAEALAWEAANPGRTALTTESQEPDVTPPSSPGILAVQPSDVSAALSVTGAEDDRGITGYSFRVGSGEWSEWQSAPVFTMTGLSRDTDYSFQHRVRDVGGNSVEGVAVQSRTLVEAPVPYQQLALSYSPRLFFPGEVGRNLGSMSAGMYRDSGTEGAPLGGYASSRRFTSNSEGLSFRSDAMPADWPEWSSVFLVNLTAGVPESDYVILTTHNNPASPVYVALDGNGVAGEVQLRISGYHGIVGVPGSTGPMLIGVECDGAATRYYLNGGPIATGAARTLLQSAGRYGFEPAMMTAGDMIEVAGWLVHDQALGPDAQLALAEAAGVA